MKAWKVNVKGDICSVVVFAPTRGIAKSRDVIQLIENAPTIIEAEE